MYDNMYMENVDSTIRSLEKEGRLIFDLEGIDNSAYMSIIMDAYIDYRLNHLSPPKFFNDLRDRLDAIRSQEGLNPKTLASLDIIEMAIEVDEKVNRGEIDCFMMPVSTTVN